MYVPVILGTAREGRESEKVARFVLAEAREYGFESEIIDVRDYRIPATDRTQNGAPAKKLGEKIGRADGLIIVSPEYNHGYPGELKMMLDMLYEQYFYKPLGICGVSSGALGGARVVEQLRTVAVELHMVPVRESVYFANVAALFDKEGEMVGREAWHKRVKPMLDDIAAWAGKRRAQRG